MELERLTLAGDQRIRVDDSNYADSWAEVAVATTTGIRRSGRANGCYVQVSTLADDGDETQTGFGFCVGRSPRSSTSSRRPPTAWSGPPGCSAPPSRPARRLTVVLDPFVTAQFLGIIGSTLNGESVVKGRSLFRDRLGETVAAPAVTLVDDPTNPLAFTATDDRRRGPRRPAQRAHRRRRPPALRAQQLHGPPGRHRVDRQRRARWVRQRHRRRVPRPVAAPGARTQAELLADVDDGLLVQSVSGLHSGVNPVSGDFSTGASGLLITNGTVGAPVREFTIASTLQRMLLDVAEVGGDVDWLPMSAAGVSLVIHDVTMSGI